MMLHPEDACSFAQRVRKRGSFVRSYAALASLLFASAVMPASGAELGELTRISKGNPFSDCTADKVDLQDGTRYRRTEIEPFIDANPAKPRNLIAVWQQDRWSNGGARGNASAFTFDGGANWTTAVPPKVTRCSGGEFLRASDPWVSISPNGAAYFMSLAFDPDLPNGSFGRNAMLVNRSTDGGRTWSDPITLIEDGPGQFLNDKNSLTADKTNSKYVYAVWDRLQDLTLPPAPPPAGRAGSSSASKSFAGDGVAAARERVKQLRSAASVGARQSAEVFFKGPTYFARSKDGGLTWRGAKEIYDPGGNSQTINNLIEVLPNGTVVNFFTEISPNGGARIGLIKSFDHGFTFSGPSYAAVITTVNGVVTPDTEDLVRDASILFDIAVDRRNGNLYLVWQDVRFSGVDAVAFSMSTDAGNTWSRPIAINQTPRSRNELRQQAFVPSIEVGAGGQLVATYYDFRFDSADNREATDFWAVLCSPGTEDCRRPRNWGDELRLTPRSFNLLNAPEARGLFLGDYMGLVAAGDRVLPAFGIPPENNRTNIYTRPIDLQPNTVAAAK